MFNDQFDRLEEKNDTLDLFGDAINVNKDDIIERRQQGLEKEDIGQFNGTVYKTSLVRTKSLLDSGPDQIWLCKRYLSVPNIWSGLRSGPKRDLLMCKVCPIEFGPVPNLDM